MASIILILNLLSCSLSIKVKAFNLIKPYLFLVVRASDNVQGITKVAPLRASLHLCEYFSKNVKFVQTSTRILDPSSWRRLATFLLAKANLISSDDVPPHCTLISPDKTVSWVGSSLLGVPTLSSPKTDVSWSNISVPVSSLGRTCSLWTCSSSVQITIFIRKPSVLYSHVPLYMHWRFSKISLWCTV